MIIGLTGGMVSGKHSLAEHLIQKRFIAFAFSDHLNDELRKMGKDITRKAQQDLGNEIRNKYGPGEIARRLILKMDSRKNYVIDGIRNPGEIAELKKQKEFFLIAIESSQESRFKRIIERNMERDPKTWEEFLKADSRDFNDGTINGLQIAKCMKMADYTIENNGIFEEFINQFEEIYLKIIQKISKTGKIK